jgi:hypothetical protein
MYSASNPTQVTPYAHANYLRVLLEQYRGQAEKEYKQPHIENNDLRRCCICIEHAEASSVFYLFD